MWRPTFGVKLVSLHTVPILHIVGSAMHSSILTPKENILLPTYKCLQVATTRLYGSVLGP